MSEEALSQIVQIKWLMVALVVVVFAFAALRTLAEIRRLGGMNRLVRESFADSARRLEDGRHEDLLTLSVSRFQEAPGDGLAYWYHAMAAYRARATALPRGNPSARSASSSPTGRKNMSSPSCAHWTTPKPRRRRRRRLHAIEDRRLARRGGYQDPELAVGLADEHFAAPGRGAALVPGPGLDRVLWSLPSYALR